MQNERRRYYYVLSLDHVILIELWSGVKLSSTNRERDGVEAGRAEETH